MHLGIYVSHVAASVESYTPSTVVHRYTVETCGRGPCRNDCAYAIQFIHDETLYNDSS